MAQYKVKSSQLIDWSVKGHKRILQNISNLLNTFMYEVSYDRVLGRNPANLDKPYNQLVPALIAETYELIQEYEPRAKVKSVNVVNDNEESIIEVVIDIE